MLSPRKLLRPLRLLIFAAIAITVALWWRGRPETFPIGDQSMYPRYQPGDELLIRVIDERDELERGADVLFSIGTTAYFGVVSGLPGDDSEAGTVPAGKVYILCLNRNVKNDSRRFGFVPREQVRGIILGRR